MVVSSVADFGAPTLGRAVGVARTWVGRTGVSLDRAGAKARVGFGRPLVVFPAAGLAARGRSAVAGRSLRVAALRGLGAAVRAAGELLHRRGTRAAGFEQDYVGVLGDAGALLVLTHPELFTTERLPVRVTR